jgi:hypothetical protein
MRLYEWCVATGQLPARRVGPVGLSDAEPRAVSRMLEALRAVPDGTPALGWVTAMLYLPGGSYDRYETRAEAERSQSGTLHLVIGGELAAGDPALKTAPIPGARP